MRALLVAAIAAMAWLPGSASAQSVPRIGGKPDLTGVWQGGTTRAGSWEEANSGLGVGGTGQDPLAPPNVSPSSLSADREPAPYQPWAAAKVLEFYNRRGVDDPAAFCLPPGLPRMNILGLFPIQIVQTPQQILILYEYMSVFRVIPLNARHSDDLLPGYMGHSVARWEGDTLVVDVTGFNDKTWLMAAGTFHSEALHLTERYTRVGKDRINYEVTMDDPKVLTRPWTVRSSMMLREGTRLQEYICAENNLDPGRYEKLMKDGVSFTRPQQ